MSLYNQIFGVNPIADVLLKILSLDKDSVPRLRDVFLTENYIVIHTRTGGGNRDYFEEKNEDNEDGPWNTYLTENRYYSHNEDDDFDSTYANFYFLFPEEYKEDLENSLKENGSDVLPSEKWKQLLESMKK